MWGILPIISVIFHKNFPWTPLLIGIRALHSAESDAWTLASGTKDGHYQVTLWAMYDNYDNIMTSRQKQIVRAIVLHTEEALNVTKAPTSKALFLSSQGN